MKIVAALLLVAGLSAVAAARPQQPRPTAAPSEGSPGLTVPTRTFSARASGRKDAPPCFERVEYADGPVWPNR